jgi:zinc transporter ZupT
MLVHVLFAAGLIMLASLAGIFFTGRLAKNFLESRLSYLVSFSAGVFLVTSGALILEVFEIYKSYIWQGIILVLIGYIVAWSLEILVPESHHHHDPHNQDGHTHNKSGARKLLFGDSIHNIGDGIILVPAFMVSPALGLAVTLSVFIHEVLQGISEFFVLKQAGYSDRQTLSLNFVTNCTIFIGVFLGYFAATSHQLEGVLLAVSAGFFIHVVIHDLLPKPYAHESGLDFSKHILLVALGLVIMASLNFYLGEEHEHTEDSPAQTPVI